MEIRGTRALVTGGGRGIGAATVQALAEAGALVIAGDVDLPAAEAVCRPIGGEAVALDVRDVEAWGRVMDRFGPIDVLVNNAGIMPLGAFVGGDSVLDRRQIDINVLGVMNGMRAVLPGMIERGRGHVVNIASAAGKIPVPHAAVYAATKHAVVGLGNSVRHELRGTGVGLSTVLPALVDTELISGTGRPRFPPPAKPRDVANAVVDAIRRERRDVYVPRIAKLTAILPVVLPAGLADRVGGWFGLDTMFMKVDENGRKAYQERMRKG